MARTFREEHPDLIPLTLTVVVVSIIQHTSPEALFSLPMLLFTMAITLLYLAARVLEVLYRRHFYVEGKLKVLRLPFRRWMPISQYYAEVLAELGAILCFFEEAEVKMEEPVAEEPPLQLEAPAEKPECNVEPLLLPLPSHYARQIELQRAAPRLVLTEDQVEGWRLIGEEARRTFSEEDEAKWEADFQRRYAATYRRGN